MDMIDGELEAIGVGTGVRPGGTRIIVRDGGFSIPFSDSARSRGDRRNPGVLDRPDRVSS
jgi:hypothetical protein